MKIWILSSEVVSGGGGGIARYVDHFARLLAAAGNEVLVISHGECERRSKITPGYSELLFTCRHQYLREFGVGIECDPHSHPAFPYQLMDYRTGIAYQFAEVVRNLVAEEGPPDVIECQEYNAIGYFVLQEKLTRFDYLRSTPIIAHFHTPDFLVGAWNGASTYHLPGYWIGRMERAFIMGADARICPSQYLCDQIRDDLREPELDVQVIRYPLVNWEEVDRRAVEPDCAMIPEICFVGRIEPRKGVMELLDACEPLWISGERFKLRLIGGSIHYTLKDERYIDTVKRRFAHRFESGDIIYEAAMTHADVLQRFSAASFIVFPSLAENFPNVCLEAMALGKLVVASCQGGQAELIGRGSTAGILFDWQQPSECTDAIRDALRLSSADRAAIGAGARERVRDLCNPEEVLRLRMEHFSQVIEDHSPKRIFPFVNAEIRNGPRTRHRSTDTAPDSRISAVIPHYNLGPFVKEAVESLLSGTRIPDEIIIVDDGSTDSASRTVIKEIEESGIPGLRVIWKRNEGLALTRNRGASEATGDYIVFLDADDCVGPEFIAKAIPLLDWYENVHYVYSWAEFFDGNKGLWISWTTDLPYLLAHNMLIPICVVRRSSFLDYGPNKREMLFGLEDYESWIALAEAGCGGVCIPESLVRYRIRKNGSMFQSLNEAQMLYLFHVISSQHSQLYRKFGVELFNLQNANGPAHIWDVPNCWQPPQRARIDAIIAERDAIWHEKERFHDELLRYRDRFGPL